jgi:hypothetical protein
VTYNLCLRRTHPSPNSASPQRTALIVQTVTIRRCGRKVNTRFSGRSSSGRPVVWGVPYQSAGSTDARRRSGRRSHATSPTGTPPSGTPPRTARQLPASEHPARAVSSGSRRVLSGLAARVWLNHATLRAFPKLGVAGSSPVVRFRFRSGLSSAEPFWLSDVVALDHGALLRRPMLEALPNGSRRREEHRYCRRATAPRGRRGGRQPLPRKGIPSHPAGGIGVGGEPGPCSTGRAFLTSVNYRGLQAQTTSPIV